MSETTARPSVGSLHQCPMASTQCASKENHRLISARPRVYKNPSQTERRDSECPASSCLPSSPASVTDDEPEISIQCTVVSKFDTGTKLQQRTQDNGFSVSLSGFVHGAVRHRGLRPS
ncbi:hypothetical protein RRG08_014719 [Elysia crispata]|uniref:Uncharacterized protein n=1 Tax=Elysia crispata TaxID=231223 RepID=A0AAE1ATT4_9GAST|nr:hypothetical protein RRG08_014719 [Elysia crispata]